MDMEQTAFQQKKRNQQQKLMRSAYNRSGLSVAALYGVVSVVSAVLIGFLVGAQVFRIVTASMSGDADAFSAGSLLEDTGLMSTVLVMSALGAGIGFAGAIPLMRKITSYKTHVPILRQDLSFPAFLVIVLSAFGLWGVGVYLGNFAELLGIPVRGTDIAEFAAPWAQIVMLVYTVLGAPVVEELVFRKTLLDVLHPYGQTCAATVTALLFGLIHGNSGQFFLAFFLGLLFAAVYQKTGRVIYTIALHFIINLTASVPDILKFAGIDAEEIFTFYVLPVLTLAGLTAVVISFVRKAEWTRLTPPDVPDANRAMFRNPGMLICVIGGLVTAASTDFAMILLIAYYGKTPLPFVGLLSTALMIAVTVFVCVLGGRVLRKRDVPDAG
ncbi:MAG: CPBP family intramembrane metalloprotease [Clostridia bacterium]|nr:CPBP family intramembrane metalloprotease [Clostridia bacterium]